MTSRQKSRLQAVAQNFYKSNQVPRRASPTFWFDARSQFIMNAYSGRAKDNAKQSYQVMAGAYRNIATALARPTALWPQTAARLEATW
jgi:hypothetical protein